MTTSPSKVGDIRARDEEGNLLDPIYETDSFAVYIGDWPQGMWEGQQGYLLYNKRHSICEGIMGTEALAIMEARQQEEILLKVIEGENLTPETPDDREFQEMMARLAEKQKH